MKHSGICWIVAALGAAPMASAQTKINYADHVLPWVETHCSKCHNPDKKKGDLDLTSYGGVMAGGGSGKVVVAGDPDGSKLFRVITHAEEPTMPPNKGRLPDKDVAVVRQWIAGGLLETASGKAVAAARSGVDLTIKAPALGRPAGPPPMPGPLALEPVLTAPRASAVMGLAASPWAPLVALAGQKQVLLYHTETHDLLGILAFPEGQPVDLKFSRNGKLLIAGGGHAAKSGRVVVWDIATGETLITVGREFDAVLASDLSPDQARVALGGPDRLVKIYATRSGEVEQRIKKHTDWVTAIAFSPDGGLLASGDRNGGLHVWDPDNGQEVHNLAGHKTGVTAIAWRDDGRVLASASEDGTVKLWDAQEGKPAKSWTAHASGVTGLATSHDGRWVTCGRDRMVTIWDAGGTKQKSFTVPGELATRVAFDADGRRVIAADWTGHVGVWTAVEGRLVGELEVNPPPLAKQINEMEQRLRETTGSRGPSQPPAASTNQAELNRLLAEIAAATNKLGKIGARLEKQTAETTRLKDVIAKKPTLDVTNQLAAARAVRNQSRLDFTNALNAVGALRKQLTSVQDRIKGSAASPENQRAVLEARLKRLQESRGISEFIRLGESVARRRRDIEQLRSAGDAAAADRLARDLADDEKRLEKLKAEQAARRTGTSTSTAMVNSTP